MTLMLRGARRHWLPLICAAGLTGTLDALATEQGFTEPRRIIELAAPELATVATVAVTAGDRVAAGQAVATLDARALEASLATADARRNARGDVDAARAMHELRSEQFARVSATHASGHARADELARARAELEIARAELASANERVRIAELEHQRIAVEIARRTITSPVDATVIEVRLEVGEAVTPANNIVAVVAVLDPLVIRLNVDLERVSGIALGQSVAGSCRGQPVAARVARIAPIADAATATVAVELEIDNAERSLLSGTACVIEL